MKDLSYQLYSSRNFDFAETLSMLTDLGYTQVEGYGALFDDASAVDAGETPDAEGSSDAGGDGAVQPVRDAALPDAGPDCAGRACGPDGIGGVCGVCPEATPVCSAEAQCAPAPPVIISELMARPEGGLLDEDGESSDWIELQNRGASPIDLSGWSLQGIRR